VKIQTSPPATLNEIYSFQLFVCGMSPKSMAAITNIKHLCDTYLKEKFKLEIIDLYKNPELAEKYQVIFSPLLIKQRPLPRKILTGTFSDPEKFKRILKYSNSYDEDPFIAK
jgi:circadian clock protein KaiB